MLIHLSLDLKLMIACCIISLITRNLSFLYDLSRQANQSRGLKNIKFLV